MILGSCDDDFDHGLIQRQHLRRFELATRAIGHGNVPSLTLKSWGRVAHSQKATFARIRASMATL